MIWFLWGRHFLNQNSYRIKFTSDEIKKIIPFKLLLIVKYYLEKEFKLEQEAGTHILTKCLLSEHHKLGKKILQCISFQKRVSTFLLRKYL